MEIREVLEKAKSIIDAPERWGKASLARFNSDGSTSYCMVGAVRMATLGRPTLTKPDGVHIGDSDRIILASIAIGALKGATPRSPFGYNYEEVSSFNDAYATTHEMVMDTFDRAIKSEIQKNEVVSG